MPNVAFDEAIFRQRERTVDNIKRIYAVVYSLSFTFILKEMFDYAKDYIIQPSASITPQIQIAFRHGLLLRLAMVTVFLSTVAVFAYQADKFLDLRYTLRPRDPQDPAAVMPEATRGGFAVDAFSLIFTLVPFIFMSYAFTRSLVDLFGIIPFFVSYQLLLGLGVGLLAIVNLPNILHLPRPNTASALTETERYAALSANWFWTNGIAIAVLTIAYNVARGSGGLCARSPFATQRTFALVFVVVALSRNIYDFGSTWPFLYVNRRDVRPDDIAGPLKLYTRRGSLAKLVLLALSGVVGLVSAAWALTQTLGDINPDTC